MLLLTKLGLFAGETAELVPPLCCCCCRARDDDGLMVMMRGTVDRVPPLALTVCALVALLEAPAMGNWLSAGIARGCDWVM